jgi:hypothetical protein
VRFGGQVSGGLEGAVLLLHPPQLGSRATFQDFGYCGVARQGGAAQLQVEQQRKPQRDRIPLVGPPLP